MKQVLFSIAIAMAVGVSAPAQADDAAPSTASASDTTVVPDVEIDGVSVSEGDTEFTVSEDEIATARDAAVEDEAENGLSASEQRLVDNLIAEVEKSGGTIDGDAVDVVPLLGGDVTLTVPVDVVVEKVTVDIDHGDVSVSATSSQADEETLAAAGPGMAAPYWAGDGDGQYLLTVKGMGDALFTWARSKLMNDGDNNYVWYAYRRKGDAHPADKSGVPDPRVKLLRIQNFPYDNIENQLVNWNEWNPASSFPGKCGGHTYNAGVSVLAASIGISFQDCDGYEVWRNGAKPSSYWLEMDQGAVLNGGSREIGYTLAWKQKQGSAGSQHDFQRVIFYWNSNQHECSHTDAGDTCN